MMKDPFKNLNDPLKEATRSLLKYAEIIEGTSNEEKKNESILRALDIELSATDIVSLLGNPERLDLAVKKLKLKAFL